MAKLSRHTPALPPDLPRRSCDVVTMRTCMAIGRLASGSNVIIFARLRPLSLEQAARDLCETRSAQGKAQSRQRPEGGGVKKSKIKPRYSSPDPFRYWTL